MTPELPHKKYHVIYADPPWSYKDKVRHERTGAYTGGASKRYPTMTPLEIASLPVESIAEDNAALFLWATFPNLPQAIELMGWWGFTYKTVGFVWVKLNCGGTVMLGTGAYTKANAEICLFGVRGRVGRKTGVNDGVLRPATNFVSSVVTTYRDNRSGRFHSAKPNQVARSIQSLFGEVSRIELFARHKREGWDVWGNQV